MVKHLSMKNSITGEMLYFRQDGTICEEASAPVRWENAIAPWLEEQGFERGKNEKSVFYHRERDLLLLLYVDDCLVDGNEEDVNWIFELLDNRFECKEREWLSADGPLDHLGMGISMDDDHIYLSMAKCISTALKMLEFEDLKERATPISQEIYASEPLDYKLRKKFMTAVGCASSFPVRWEETSHSSKSRCNWSLEVRPST